MRLLCLIFLLGAVAAGIFSSKDHGKDESISSRIKQITGRLAWQSHNWSLPLRLLKRAYIQVGDDTRLRAFVRKLVLGQPVAYAHLGGSISVFGLAKRKEDNWHAIWLKWLELTFTTCGDLHPNTQRS
jgi:hypothetical protein